MLPRDKVRLVDKWIDDLNPPRNQKHPYLRSFCKGGFDVGDTRDGIASYTWEAWTDGGTISIRNIQTTMTYRVLKDINITEISVAFDRNLNLFIAYKSGNTSKLWTGINGSLTGAVIVELEDANSPRVALDDNRPIIGSKSDIIFAYVLNSTLYCRYQRDQFFVERKLNALSENTFLHRIGMGNDYRFLFLLKKKKGERGDKIAYDGTVKADGTYRFLWP